MSRQPRLVAEAPPERTARDARGGRDVVADVGWAAACTLVVMAAIEAGGGIGEWVGNGDLHAAYLPWYRYVGHAVLSEGRLPLWNRHPFCGMPVMAIAQSSALYPPVLFIFHLLTPWVALQVFIAFHAFVIAWGMTAYLRAYGVARGAAAVGVLVAVAAVFRGALLTGVDHPCIIACTAWLPVMLVTWRHAAVARDVRWVGAFALAAGMQWVAGYPEFALDAAVLLTAMALVADDAPLRWRVGVLVAGLGLGAGLAALQIVPLQEVVAESPRVNRAFNYEGFRGMFGVGSTAQLVHLLGFRFGVGALGLAALGVAGGGRTRLAWLLAFVWALFAVNLPFRLVYLLPPYAGVRFPFGWMALEGIFLGCLAAAGLGMAWRSDRRAVRAAALLLALLAGGQALRALWLAPTSVPEFQPGAPGFRAPDLQYADARLAVFRAHLRPDVRLVAEREAVSGGAILEGLAMPNGHDPSVPPRRIMQLLDDVLLYDGLSLRGTGFARRDWKALAARPELAALLGVGLVAIPRAQAEIMTAVGFTPVAPLPPDEVLLERPAIPRARLVHRTVEGADEDATHALVLAHAAEAATLAVIERGALHAPLAERPRDATETVRIVRDDPERVEIDVHAASAALLVLTDTYYPGWHASVDGVPVEIARADHAFRGVRVEAGSHHVIFRYAPRTVLVGGMGSAAAALAVAGCLVWARRPARG